jgi:ATP-dependent RNA helicase SUPV3L1/SUV3
VADPGAPATYFEALGYRVLGPRAIRLDMLERVAKHLRDLAKAGPLAIDATFLSLTGSGPEEAAAILSALGYRRQGTGSAMRFRRPLPKVRATTDRPRPDSPFARLKTDLRTDKPARS